jgi:asparagine synthase (glutamine-hydrolysing)
MCGIAGIVRFDGAPTDARALRRMAAALAHRGPDGEGFHIAGPVGLAHRRLAIIDPVGGHQPLIDRESGLAITYNGEVYNYIEIRRELAEHDFVTSSDTEVVLRAWRRWGAAAVDRFRGMFAFALHDPGTNKVFLVRDRVGIKPLYYRVGASAVCFASEIGALLASEIGSADVDETSVSLFLRLGYVPTPRTIYRGIHKLEPGSILSIDITTGAIGRQRYWRGEAAIRSRPEADALAELDALLIDTMRLYVRSDVPFGAFLSGGVDSSLVTALMAQVVGEPVRSFSIGFAEATHSELPFAQEAAGRLGTRHHGAVLDPELSISLLQRLAGRFGEPFGDSSCLPTWYVSRLAGAELKMVLSGDGGDELFAGYESYPAVYSASGGGGAGTRGTFANFARAAAGFARHPFQRSWTPEHHRRRDTFSPSERALLTGRAAAPLPDEDIAEPSTADPVTRCQLRDLGSYLLDDILVKVDRMSMDNSLEVRVPLLDHKLIEFAFSLPLDLRLRQVGDSLVGKYLLKRAAERFFPRSFLDRPKQGFGIPIQRWLKGPLQPIVRDLLENGADHLAPLIDPGSVRRVVRGFYTGQDESPAKVWALLSFRLWLDASRAGTGARAVETTA